MKNLKVKDPETGKELSLVINAEEFEKKEAWRIEFEDNRTALIGIDQHGIWKQFDNDDLDTKFVEVIGKAIEENKQY